MVRVTPRTIHPPRAAIRTTAPRQLEHEMSDSCYKRDRESAHEPSIHDREARPQRLEPMSTQKDMCRRRAPVVPVRASPYRPDRWSQSTPTSLEAGRSTWTVHLT